MVAEIARDPECRRLAISGIGGIATWREAAEFVSMGATNVQVCTAAMTHGFKFVEDMASGLANWMDGKGYGTTGVFFRAAVPNFVEWQHLNINFKTVAAIDQDLCIRYGKLGRASCRESGGQSGEVWGVAVLI